MRGTSGSGAGAGAEAAVGPPGRLAILYDTVHDLTSTLALREVLQRLLDRVLIHLDSEIASILLAGPDGRLRIEHARGLPAEVVESTSLAPGDGISGWVARQDEPVLVEDVERDPRFRRRNHERYYTSSAISVPLRIRSELLGVLNVNNRSDRRPYVPEHLRLMEAIAAHAAVAIDNARRYEETLQRARFDALTGLANHGHFWATLETELERGRRYGRELALVLLDVDHFKTFNDRYGHVRGDEALAGVARTLRACSRVHDLGARYGGEEFGVLLPETRAAGGCAFAEKIRQSLAAQAFAGAPPGALTVSVGVAAFPEHAREARGLVERADAELFRAKHGGRNRVCAPGSPCGGGAVA